MNSGMPLQKARVKTYPKTPPDLLRHHRGYVSISLSNRITTSEIRLRQVFDWTRDHLSSFDIVIGDYFHRHNLRDLRGFSRSGALSRALIDGQEVAHRVQIVLDSLKLPNVAVRLTGTLCDTPEFPERLAVLNELYESRAPFRDLIDIATDAFLQRFAPHRLHTEEARRHSQAYQLEELTVFELLSAQGYSVNVYPGGAHLPVMKELVAGTLEGTMPAFNDLILVELRFRSGR